MLVLTIGLLFTVALLFNTRNMYTSSGIRFLLVWSNRGCWSHCCTTTSYYWVQCVLPFVRATHSLALCCENLPFTSPKIWNIVYKKIEILYPVTVVSLNSLIFVNSWVDYARWVGVQKVKEEA